MIHKLLFFVILLLSDTVGNLHAASQFTGSESCSACHSTQIENWQGSHHQLAMQHASETSVLADFDNTKFTYSGVTTTFFRKDDQFYVNTDGRDGQLQDFEVKYTFGVTPLQQYLVEFPDGRVQVLGSAWDTRPADEGGQRWFHIYPDETINHEDELHWTAPLQNWNYMCADCHSTNLKKRYSSSKDTFDTSWSEISVGCEACHGPGSEHIAWAAQAETARNETADKGLNVDFSEREGADWKFSEGKATAMRSSPNESRQEIEVCASCHSRRGIIKEGAAIDASFLDHYIPALLSEPLYHADGQIQDEVYVWGSFTQSKMYSAGVTCSDCHDPHSQELKLPGDAVCSQCHSPAKFASSEHHHHAPGSAGSSCTNCHMPETTYMVVDPRRDHSIRIPRPDHSIQFDTPNACTQCHEEKDNQWAAEHFSAWYPDPKTPFQGWTETISHARQGNPAAGPALADLVLDQQSPEIARATAIVELQNYLNADTAPALQAALQDESTLVRMSALRVLDGIAPESRFPIAGPLLQDGSLAVRTEAARVLAGAPRDQMSTANQNLLDKVTGEYIATQQLNADRVESQANLGNLYLRLGDPGQAELHFRRGIRLDPGFEPSYINLSDLYRSQNMNDQALKVLGEGISKNPDAASLHHSLGLALIRQGNTPMAVEALARASTLAPQISRYSYVHGIALNSLGQANEGIKVLESANVRHPNDRDIIFALVTMNRDAGQITAAQNWASKLLELNPADSQALQLLQSLER